MSEKCSKCGAHINGHHAAGSVENGVKLCLKCLLEHFKVKAAQ